MNSKMPSPMVISHSLSLYLEQQQLTQLALMCCFKAYRLLGTKGTSSGDLIYSIMKWYSSKNLHAKRCEFNPWVRKISWRSKWQPTAVLLPGKSHRQRSLMGYSPCGHKESDTTEQLNNNNSDYN